MSQPAVPQEMPAPAVSQTATGLRASWALPVTNEGTGGAPIEAFVVYMQREDEAIPAAGVDMGLATEYEAPNLLANYRYTFAVRAPLHHNNHNRRSPVSTGEPPLSRSTCLLSCRSAFYPLHGCDAQRTPNPLPRPTP